MAAADVFVILTKCQYEKGGYQNRFSIGGEWYTMPVMHGLEPICDKRYCMPDVHFELILNRLPVEMAAHMIRYARHVGESLCDTNVAIIREMACALGIKTRIVTDSDISCTVGGTARLVKYCEHVGADAYLSGPSGRNYLDESLFKERGIHVEYFEADKQDRLHALEVLCG